MKRRPEAIFLMADMGVGSPPADLQNSNIRRPRIRRVVADHHPIELQESDPALHDLLDLIGKDGLKEFGQFISGGFRMVELLGVIDDAADQLPECIVDDLKPQVPVLPLVSTRVKLMANALVTVALRALGATVCGPFEKPVFLKPADRLGHQELGQKLHAVPSVKQVFEDGVWWAEVPPILLDIHDRENVLQDRVPCPHAAVELFLS